MWNMHCKADLLPDTIHASSLHQITVAPPYLQGICLKTFSGCLRPQIVPNPMYAVDL